MNDYIIKLAIPGSLGKLISPAIFRKLRQAYEKKWPAALAVLNPRGRKVMGKIDADADSGAFRSACRAAIDGALRRGEPLVEEYGGSFIWGVPLLLNTRLVGGVVASVRKRRADELGGGENMVRAAAVDLFRFLEDFNLTNAPLLHLLRSRELENPGSDSIHAFKFHAADFRSIYIKEEPALLAAIRKGAREEAREALNRILVVLLTQAGDDLALLKSFFLELVVLMCRAAVEAGCDAAAILGANYERFAELSAIQSDETLAPWLRNTLERLIDAIHDHQNASPPMFLKTALNYMHQHLAEDISRDATASAVGMSNAHFSRQFKREMRETFTDVLNRMRVDHAAELLARTERSLYMISFDSGFKDQSYFTKVFKKYMRKTPREYRMELLAARKSGA